MVGQWDNPGQIIKKELARLKTPGHEEERQLVAELGLKVAEQRTFPAPHETNFRKIPKGLSQGGTVDCGDKSASRTHFKDGVRSTAVPSLSCGSRLALQLARVRQNSSIPDLPCLCSKAGPPRAPTADFCTGSVGVAG